MAELISEEEENKLKIRLKSQRHVRALLIIVNLLLVGYILYYIGDLVVEKVNQKDADIVALNDLSRGKSKKRYEELMQGRQKTIGDYILYGTYLHVSEDAFSIESYTPMNDIFLLDTHDGALIRQTIGEKLNQGIDLKTLLEGDYLLAQGADTNKEVLKIVVGKEKYEETVYSLPLDASSGLRKKITLYAYPHNPAFVIKVRDVYELNKSHYDLVLQGSKENREFIKNVLKNEASPYHQYDLKIKEFESDDSLADLYETSSLMAISLRDYDGESFTMNSYYLESDFATDDILFEGPLKYYDEDPFIRELGGYAFKSGSRYTEVPSSFDVIEHLGIHDRGKIAFAISANEEQSFVSSFESILAFMTK